MDPHEEDATSDFEGSDVETEFTSVKSTHVVHSYEYGRRYQGYLRDRYGLPNDDQEHFREGLKHKLYVDYILDGKLFLAPIGNHPQKIVDLGTGFGYWAQDVAENFPSARVIATDISVIHPNWSSPNLEFRVEDLDDENRPWTSIYIDADLIHIRALLVTLRNPRRIIEQAFENLRPGGWIECHELIPRAFAKDGLTVEDDYPLNRLYSLIDASFTRAYGWQVNFPRLIPDVLREVGFINLSERHNHIPIGRWHRDGKMREMGMFSQHVITDLLDPLLSKHDLLGLNQEEAQDLGQSIIDAFDDSRIHAQLDWLDCWAQKPED